MKSTPLLGIVVLSALLLGVVLLASNNTISSENAHLTAVAGATADSSNYPTNQITKDVLEPRDTSSSAGDATDNVTTETTLSAENNPETGANTADAYSTAAESTYASEGSSTAVFPANAVVPTTTVQPNDAAPRILLNDNPPQNLAPSPGTSNPYQPPEELPSGERTEPATPKEKIQDIGSSLRQLQREVKRVENVVKETVTRTVEEARSAAHREAVEDSVEPPARVFDPEERSRRMNAATEKVSQDVRNTIASGDVQNDALAKLESVLKSSLEEIQILIRDETGVDVDLSPSARTVTDAVKAESSGLARAREELLKREGLDLYTDSDRDGISNYDEKHIYGTDPLNAFTANTSLTDGERVLLGFDPLSNNIDRVPVESPRIAGEVADDVFEVHSINVALRPIVGAGTESTSEDSPPAFEESVTFSGRALPNSFVTLYIFSTPIIVTVKANVSGAWTYTLDTELSDGEHELYVATVDAGGRILAKSPAVPFVKRAEAAEFTPLLVPAVSQPTPIDILQDNLVLVGGVVLTVFVLIGLVILGVRGGGTPKVPPSVSA